MKNVSFLQKALLLIGIGLLILFAQKPQAKETQSTWWSIQSVDTMKYSRDPSRAKLKDTSYDLVIDQQVRAIAQTGATHVAIGTPYDEEFVPILRRWVSAARKYGLHVWFRGNFSGWEKWFGYDSISRDEHKQKTTSFIQNHADLFVDGDIFTPCPECENGGPGDPRQTGDTAGHRTFLKELHVIAKREFDAIRKNVDSGFFSMNGDVARLIMDAETTKALGGIVVIDHYVASPKRLAEDVREIAKRSGGHIVLGEFGAPIPDIHGTMSEENQATWIRETLLAISMIPEVVGVNYWTSVGGSTQLWTGKGEARKGVGVLQQFFTPNVVRGTVTDELRSPITHASVTRSMRSVKTDARGTFTLPYVDEGVTINIEADGYKATSVRVGNDNSDISITLVRNEQSLWYRIRKFLQKFIPACLPARPKKPKIIILASAPILRKNLTICKENLLRCFR
jgi:hypothetical protein